MPWDLLVKDVPPEHHHDLDYIIGMLDWEANVDPEFVKHRLCHPRPVKAEEEMAHAGYSEKWIVYSTGYYSAKELTVFPGRSVTIRDRPRTERSWCRAADRRASWKSKRRRSSDTAR